MLMPSRGFRITTHDGRDIWIPERCLFGVMRLTCAMDIAPSKVWELINGRVRWPSCADDA
jgi:hypothetical protein